jgi:hypothetical protein
MPIIKLKYETWEKIQDFQWKMRKMKFYQYIYIYTHTHKAHMSNVHFNIFGWNINFHVNNFVSTFTTFNFNASQSFPTLTIWIFSFPFFRIIVMHVQIWHTSNIVEVYDFKSMFEFRYKGLWHQMLMVWFLSSMILQYVTN